MGEMCFGNNAFTKHLQWTCAALPPLSIIYSEGYTVTWLMPCLKYNQRCHRLILFSLTYKLFINWIIWLHLQQIRLSPMILSSNTLSSKWNLRIYVVNTKKKLHVTGGTFRHQEVFLPTNQICTNDLQHYMHNLDIWILLDYTMGCTKEEWGMKNKEA